MRVSVHIRGCRGSGPATSRNERSRCRVDRASLALSVGTIQGPVLSKNSTEDRGTLLLRVCRPRGRPLGDERPTSDSLDTHVADATAPAVPARHTRWVGEPASAGCHRLRLSFRTTISACRSNVTLDWLLLLQENHVLHGLALRIGAGLRGNVRFAILGDDDSRAGLTPSSEFVCHCRRI